MGAEVRAAFDEWRTLELFGSIGRIWQRPFDRPPTLLTGRRSELVDLIVASLTATPRRSVLLVGEHGAGKTALARAALDRSRGRDRVRGDRVPDPRRPGVRRRARLAREAARRGDARPERGLVAAGAAGGALRRPASPQSAGTSRRAPPARRIGHDDTGRRGHAHGARRAPRRAAARDVGLRPDPGGTPSTRRTRSPSPGMRSSTTASTSRPTTRPSPVPTTSPSSSCPASRSPGGLLRLDRLHGRRRARGRPGQLRRRPTCSRPCGRLGAPARTPRRLGGTSARGGSRVLRAAHPAATGRRDLRRRADRDDQGGADRPDAAARRPPVPRPDRDGQDGDRKGAGRVPVRVARPARASRHERVPDPRRRSSGSSRSRRTSGRARR